jgi:histidine triad (HIT) family protein
LFEVIRMIAVRYQLEPGYRVMINSGTDAGQTVPHLHVHVIAGRCVGFGVTTPP